MKEVITITTVTLADPDVSTDVVHVVTLSDGRTLELWSGQASYNTYDTHTGSLEVGAELVGETPPFDEFETTYHFAPAEEIEEEEDESPAWEPVSHWTIHPDWPLEDWHYDVCNDSTRQSYVEWVNDRIEEASE